MRQLRQWSIVTMAADSDPDMKMMSARERAICSSLCFCLALSVLSGVAMIYLSVIIYIPSQREILSGFNEVGWLESLILSSWRLRKFPVDLQVSVMCTTVEKRRIHGDMEECKYGSCAEWCLSKGGGDCTQLIVR